MFGGSYKPSISTNYICTAKSINSRKMPQKELPSFSLQPETMTEDEKPIRMRQDPKPIAKEVSETLDLEHQNTELGIDGGEPPSAINVFKHQPEYDYGCPDTAIKFDKKQFDHVIKLSRRNEGMESPRWLLTFDHPQQIQGQGDSIE